MSTNASQDDIMNMVWQVGRLVRRRFQDTDGAQRKLHEKISPYQIHALFTIQKSASTVGELADEMNITFPSASSLVDRLVKNQWVERGLDPDDRRIIRLTVTAVGAELTAKMKKQHKKVFQAMLSEMPEEDRQSLYRILTNLHTKLELEKDKKGE